MSAHGVHDDWPASALAAADKAFRLLVVPPAPLALDVRGVGGGLPDRHVPLDELRGRLLDRATSYATRDAVWRLLAAATRSWGPQWVVGAVGVALPGLVRLAGGLARGYRGDVADLDAEVLTGFLTALRTVDVEPPRLFPRLLWAAKRAGLAARWAETAAQVARLSPAVASRMPARPYGHPDLVLGRAVAAGVITVEQADLIGASRLERVPVERLASALGVEASVVRMRRRRAELALVAALASGDLHTDTTVPPPEVFIRRRDHHTPPTSAAEHDDDTDQRGSGKPAEPCRGLSAAVRSSAVRPA